MKPRKKIPPEVRFWRHVEKLEGDDACWNWRAHRDDKLYGLFGVRAGKTVYAHRFSWELANGPIPDGLWVLHKCDNPSCVRPKHLFLGTHQDNMKDQAAKGRTTRGELDGMAKLTASQVVEIRTLLDRGRKGVDLARTFSVSIATISRIKHRIRWQHL